MCIALSNDDDVQYINIIAPGHNEVHHMPSSLTVYHYRIKGNYRAIHCGHDVQFW